MTSNKVLIDFPFRVIISKKNTYMKNWFLRTFRIISEKKANELNLTHVENIHGDGINCLNCRSIWKDDKGRAYRVSTLKSN